MTKHSSHPYEVVDAATFARRLDDADWLEAPITEDASPLTIVDLSGPAAALPGNPPPATTSRVFVALGGSADLLTRQALDVALDNDDDDRAIAEMAETCAVAPRAASTLAQLLRTAETGTIAQALWRESVTYSMLLAGPEFAAWLRERPARTPARTDDGNFPLAVDDHGDRIDIVLNRPHVHNAYNAAMRDALVGVLRTLMKAADPPAVQLSGRGPSFCSGGDLDEFGTTPDVVLAHAVRMNHAPGLLLHALGARATAVVHGACIGAGTELPAFCARVEAAADAYFRLPEVAMGLVPGAGGTVSVARRIGRQRTALLALTGRTIDAPTALEWGLVDAVVP